MFCRNCGVNIPDDSVFCYKCGVPVLTSESEDGVKQKEENNGSELQATIQKLQPLIDPITETEETQNRYVYPAAEQQPKEKKKSLFTDFCVFKALKKITCQLLADRIPFFC